MNNNSKIFVLLLFTSLLLSACGSPQETAGTIETFVFQTQQISELQTAAAGGETNGGDGDEDEATPEPSETPTITLTPTPGVPIISVSQATNCRSGPSANYGFRGTFQVGQEAEVIGVWEDGDSYVIIENPNQPGECWLWLQYANITDFSAYDLPSYDTPPTPTPTATATPPYIWQGSWTTWIESGGLNECSMTLAHTGDEVDGNYVCAGFSGEIHGTLSEDLSYLSGTWENNFAQTGSFEWQRKDPNFNQFIGNYNDSFAWCGARAGASQPSPCEGP